MKKIYYTNEQITGYVNDIIRQLLIDMLADNFMPDYVVGLTRGGLVPALMLSHYLNVPMHTLKVSMRDAEHCESNLWMAEDAFKGKNILIVDDINDSGETLNWIKYDWESGCHADSDKWLNVWNHNVKFATIVNNDYSKFEGVDYSAVHINKFEEPCWIVFPWEEWWKN